MSVWTYACLVVGLLLLAAPAGALIPDNITLSIDKPWLTAGSGETATITVQVSNSTSGNVSFPGVAINFAADSVYGSILPASALTDSAGMTTAVFNPTTRSGDVTISAGFFSLGQEVSDATVCRVDHAAPDAIANLWYESEVTAGETTEIVIRMVDEYRNPVDNKNETETVNFMVGSPTGGAVFIGGTDEISVPVNAAGNATATLRVDTAAGENMVLATFPGDIGWRYLTITGLANGEPADIYQAVSPKVEDSNPDYYPELPLGEQFAITYALYDEYGNPAGDRQIRVNVQPISGSLISGEWFITTNSLGKAQITYSSSARAGVAEIVATAVDNDSVSCKQKVGFYSADPTGMVLTAVPQTIASGDVKGDIVSSIRAKVMDSKGNPVRNQSVSFRITGVDDEGNLMIDEPPRISNGSSTSKIGDLPIVAMTDKDGFATIDFHPGNFTRDMSHPQYNDTASGSATIQAEWEGMQEDTTVSFRNYPYLSINVTVDHQVVKVNESVNVTIQLIGDGWALQKKPIDAVLVIDTSGSMTDTDVQPTRMKAAQNAAKDFVDRMDLVTDEDRVALVSFAFDADLEQGLTSDVDDIKGAINSLSPVGGTNMRMAYYTAIKYLKENGGSNAVKAVILMSDGNWNYHGSPLAKGVGYADNNRYLTSDFDGYPYWAPLSGYCWSGSSYYFSSEKYEWYHNLPEPKGDASGTQKLDAGYWYDTWNHNQEKYLSPTNIICTNGQFTNQNMSVYANSGDETDKVRIYSIGFASDLDSDVEEDLGVLSSAAGGKYVWAGNEEELRNVYTDIATKLQEAASVNTTMDLAFDKVMINTSTPTEDVFEYVYDSEHPPVSTQMVKYWTDNKTTIWGPMCENQSGDWEGDQTLSFEVGDIYLNQTWETTFRLKVLKEGNIDIFGNDSVIRFNGTVGPTELHLPHTFITASLNLSETDIGAAQIWLTRISLNTDDPGILVPTWGLTYTGNRSVTQKVMYQFSQDNIWWDGNWHEADTLHHPADTNVNGTYSTTLNLGEKEGWYKIRVFAQENTPDDDGASDAITWDNPVEVGTSDRVYIKIS